MRVLVIAPHYNYFIRDQTNELAKYVDEIHVFVKYNPLVGIFSHIPFWRYARHLKNYTLDKILNLNNLPDNVTIYIMNLLYTVPDGRNKKLGEIIRKNIIKIIEKEGIKFDIIHAHFVYHYGYAGAKLKEKYNTLLIVTAHGDDIYDFPFRNRDWVDKIKWVLNQADHIITVSPSNREILIEKLEISGNKISVIPNGFDSKIFYPIDKIEVRQKLGLPLNRKIILNVASLILVKGHRYLIEAMREIVKHRTDVLCVIVGDGMLKKDLENQIKKLNLENYVKLVGARPHHEIPLWMNAADVFVLPSLRESFGVVQIEAMACGKPVVATRNGGSEEIITSEDYGLLCEPANPKDLAEKILIALEKEWNREKIRRYAERFTWEIIAKEIFDIYHRIC